MKVRMGLVVVLGLTSLRPLSSGQYYVPRPTPFGLHAGERGEDVVRAVGRKNLTCYIDNRCETTVVPRPYGSFDYYILWFTNTGRLALVEAVIKKIATDPVGQTLALNFNTVEIDLSKKYGSPASRQGYAALPYSTFYEPVSPGGVWCSLWVINPTRLPDGRFDYNSTVPDSLRLSNR